MTRGRDIEGVDRRAGGNDTGDRDVANVLGYALRKMNAEDDIPNFKDGVNANMSTNAQGITGGDQVAGYRLDSEGLVFWIGGVETVVIRPATGDITIKGDLTGSKLQTATSGNRVVIDGSTDIDTIRLYSGLSGETTGGGLQITTFNAGLASRQASLNLTSPSMSSGPQTILNMKSAPNDASGLPGASLSTGNFLVNTSSFTGGGFGVSFPSSVQFNLVKVDGASNNLRMELGPAVALKGLAGSQEVQVRGMTGGSETGYATISAEKFNKNGKESIFGSRSADTVSILTQLLGALDRAGLITDITTA